MTPPTVTVVIPTYDRPDMAERAVRSALAQVPQPVVVLVDDGGALPLTEGVLSLEREGSIVVCRQPNRGLPAARNFGATKVTTEFLLFLDDDDCLLSGALAALEQGLRDAPDSPCSAGGGHRRFQDGRIKATEWPEARVWDFAALLEGDPFFVGAVMMRHSEFLAVGGFETRIPLSEDWDLWLKLAARGPFKLVNIEAVEYFVHGANMSASGKVAGMASVLAVHYLKQLDSERRRVLGPKLVTYIVDTYAARVAWHVRTGLRSGQIGRAWKDLVRLLRIIGLGLRFPAGRLALRRAVQAHRQG